jgi:hypothetical protein
MKYWFLILMAIHSMAYDQKHIRINSSSYQRYIKPQILNIFSDYKKLVLTFNDDFSLISNCFDDINKIYKESIKENTEDLSDLVIKMRANIQESNLIKKDLFLKASKLYLDSTKTPIDLKNMYNSFYFMVIDNIDKSYRNQFNLLWVEFISPVQREIIFKNNSNFLKIRLSNLNASWNSFNVHMNKRNIKISKAQESRLEIIHRRWRSILKLIVVP